LEVGGELGLGGDARVGEEEAFVAVVGDEDFDFGVDFLGGEEAAWGAGDEEGVDVGAWFLGWGVSYCFGRGGGGL
jgi:hypothetical protein